MKKRQDKLKERPLTKQIQIIPGPTSFAGTLATSGDADRGATVAVVIDVLRFTTAATAGLANGAACVRVCKEVEEAKLKASKLNDAFLCGERNCRPIPGFDLGNSPAEYVAGVVSGRELVFTTTNGTRAADFAARIAGQILLAAFTNVDVVVEHLLSGDWAAISLICAGTDGEDTEEDCLLAGCIAARLAERLHCKYSVDSLERLWADRWLQVRRSIERGQTTLAAQLGDSRGGRNVVASGYESDLSLAANMSSLDVVPLASSGELAFRIG